MPDITSPDTQVASDELVDTVLAASRALVAVAARSLAAAGDDVTLPQYRALVVLAVQGPRGTAELAAALAVNPSTATRMCDRLVRKGLVRRHRQAGDRRAVRIALTAAGRTWSPTSPGAAGPSWRGCSARCRPRSTSRSSRPFGPLPPPPASYRRPVPRSAGQAPDRSRPSPLAGAARARRPPR